VLVVIASHGSIPPMHRFDKSPLVGRPTKLSSRERERYGRLHAPAAVTEIACWTERNDVPAGPEMWETDDKIFGRSTIDDLFYRSLHVYAIEIGSVLKWLVRLSTEEIGEEET